MILRLYTRRGCHLCEDMLLALEEFGVHYPFVLETIDVDTKPGLVDRYGDNVPVLTDQLDQLVCQHRFDREAVVRTISA